MSGAAPSAKKPGYTEFKAAVLEFSDAPSAANLARYLRASRALDGLDYLVRPTTRPAPSNSAALEQLPAEAEIVNQQAL
jgi:hypothetical protein